MKQSIPESLRQQLVRAGKARAATMTHAERSKGGKMSWKRRLEKAQQKRVAPPPQEPQPEPAPAIAPTWPPQD